MALLALTSSPVAFLIVAVVLLPALLLVRSEILSLLYKTGR